VAAVITQKELFQTIFGHIQSKKNIEEREEEKEIDEGANVSHNGLIHHCNIVV